MDKEGNGGFPRTSIGWLLSTRTTHHLSLEVQIPLSKCDNGISDPVLESNSDSLRYDLVLERVSSRIRVELVGQQSIESTCLSLCLFEMA